MKRSLLLIVIFLGFIVSVKAQIGISSTNPLAEQIMKGNYNPVTYLPSVISSKADIVEGMINYISTDSLKSYIKVMGSFYNRNTCSDTVSTTFGIGAARRWAYQKFQDFSVQNENRLITSYLHFTQTLSGCSMNRFRNIFTVLPGTDTTDKSIILIEGHIDSRCEDVNDGNCKAQGIEDNASGSALVMELARVMGKYSFKNTIVFMLTIGEEQGLIGANAFAAYVGSKGIKVKTVLNNDVIGGIYCGKTASPPTDCVNNEGAVDSTHVRIFSLGNYTSKHKALARFINLEYKEEVLPLSLTVPMNIRIMIPLDRTGRGGDHQPFSDRGITAIRFSAEHEHGHANVTAIGYTDRQHTTRDTLGVDTDGDMEIDSFFVDFNYLKRNSIINGTAAAMAAMGPAMPDFIIYNDTLEITKETGYKKYKISIRKIENDYNSDTIISFSNSLIYKLPKIIDSVYISVASVDSIETESLLTIEKKIVGELSSPPLKISERFKNLIIEAYPNPVKNLLKIKIAGIAQLADAELKLFDISGKIIAVSKFKFSEEYLEGTIDCSGLANGIYNYSIHLGKEIIKSDKILVAK